MVSLCFPATAKVWTQTGSHLIPDLKGSDHLQTLRPFKIGTPTALKKDSFLTYLHFDPKVRAEFLTLKADNGSGITITGSHLLFKKSETQGLSPVQAKSIKVGDSLVYLNENKEMEYPKVTEISTVTLNGVYAPLTKSGTMIVDGFLVSCYADVESHQKAHSCLALARLWYAARLRSSTKGQAQKSAKPNGIHAYAKVLIKVRNFIPGLTI